MCEGHTTDHELTEKAIKVTDISQSVVDMPSPRGFVMADVEHGIRPKYAKSFKTMYLLMHWPMINEDDSKVDETVGVSSTGLSMYAAVLEHGKTHVAEIFFADEKTKAYRGTHKAFSLEFPDNVYDEGYDDWLMDELANRVLGVRTILK